MNLTKQEAEVLRDTLGTGVAGKVSTRNLLSLYILSQMRSTVDGMCLRGLMERKSELEYSATEAGKKALLGETP